MYWVINTNNPRNMIERLNVGNICVVMINRNSIWIEKGVDRAILDQIKTWPEVKDIYLGQGQGESDLLR